MLAKRADIRWKSTLLLVGLIGLGLACTDVTADPIAMPGPGGEEEPPPPAYEPEPCGKIDFLFVVDDSYSMYEEQSNLGQNFPKFLDVIDQHVNSAGAFLDYRLAVTTTGVQTADSNTYGDAMDGAFRGECGLEQPWVGRTDFGVQDVFSCRAAVGVDGTGIEMPVYAIELALSEGVTASMNRFNSS